MIWIQTAELGVCCLQLLVLLHLFLVVILHNPFFSIEHLVQQTNSECFDGQPQLKLSLNVLNLLEINDKLMYHIITLQLGVQLFLDDQLGLLLMVATFRHNIERHEARIK